MGSSLKISPKLALVIKDFDPAFGGGERYSVSLARELKRQGIAFDVLCRHSAPDLQNEFSVRILPVPGKTFSRSVDFDLAFQEFIATHPYSCVLGLTQVEGCDIYRLGGGLLSVWDKIKYSGVWGRTKKTFSLNHRANLHLEKQVLEHPRLKFLVVNSVLVQAQICEEYPKHRERVLLIDNAVQQDVFFQKNKTLSEKKGFLRGFFKSPSAVIPDLTRDPGGLILLFAGNNFERKGLFSLFEALSELPNKNQFSLIVAGRGNTALAQKLVSRKGLEAQVFFAGSVSNMAELYNAVDLFVLPTQYDPCSNACLEALACGLPVITTDWNGAGMYLKNGAGIVLSSKKLKQELKSALSLCLDAQILSRMKQKAVEAVNTLSFGENATRMAELIRRVQEGV